MSDIGEHDRIILNSIFNPFLPIGEPNYDGDLAEELTDNEEITPSVARAKEIEVQGVQSAEAGDLDGAERLFTEALHISERASGYNNRAQVFRLQGKDDEAILDLNRAIEMSGGSGKAGCQAYCQRALLHRRNGRDVAAKEDFTKAAQLGSLFARHQLVEMNPYAAMCNQMLNDMMMKLNRMDYTNGVTKENDKS
uniref:Tetratricopeptide repeat protein 36 n=1 Tax=Lygus hesperus TaxID=30085 RepID=A0A0A9Y350_LYGHE